MDGVIDLLLPGTQWDALRALIWVPFVALALDWWRGEPPAAIHPVVWMGKALGWCGERWAPLSPVARDLRVFWTMALAWCVLAAVSMAAAWGLQWLALRFHDVIAAALLGLLLKPLLSWRMLHDEVLAVEEALARSLPEGRGQLARLVSREVSDLTAVQVRESAIESLAENLNDSVVAPLFWFVLLGLPGAALYRLANTADAMWGYPGMRGGRYWQWAGKWAARADDVLSWLPARITALLLAVLARGVPLTTVARLARRTPSPNSGWPMAAMALALGVRLAKPGVYVLHADARDAGPLDTHRAAKLGTLLALALVPVAVVAHMLIAILATWVGA
jgi:adenosylcobinamide-phosphate synthase